MRTDDETGRLISYLIAVYEIAFGFIIAGGLISRDSGTAHMLIRAALSFFLAGVGLHFFVNLERIDKGECKRKSRKLWIGIGALLGGIATAGTVSGDAVTSHVFFIVYLSFIVVAFLYFGAVRHVPILGALVYGIARFLPVYAGMALAGKCTYTDVSALAYYLICYVAFHVLCEFLRWSAAEKSTRVSILAGFVLMLGLLTYMFWRSSHLLEDITSKLLVMSLILVLLALVSVPPLNAIRSMKALPLFSIFPKGLAGGVVLTVVFYIVMQKDSKLLTLLLLPVAIVGYHYRLAIFRREKNDEPQP